MQRIHQCSALIFIAIAGYMMWESWELEYYTPVGPGGGFFPFWLGAVLGALSIVWLVQVSRPEGKPEEGKFLPDWKGRIQIASMIAALVVTALLMDLLGYQLTMFFFLLFMLLFIGRQAVWTSLIISAVGSVGVFYVFGTFLDVRLPLSSLSLLAGLGF